VHQSLHGHGCLPTVHLVRVPADAGSHVIQRVALPLGGARLHFSLCNFLAQRAAAATDAAADHAY
jgi:hypothetical protein